MAIHLAIPLLREYDTIKNFLQNISTFDADDVYIWFCINNPLEWHNKSSFSDYLQENEKTYNYLVQQGFRDVDLNNPVSYKYNVIDKFSFHNAFAKGKSGVGQARKIIFDHICKYFEKNDVIISMDADTHYEQSYVKSIVKAFQQHKSAIGLCGPYYHPAIYDDEHNNHILRYEIYLRHYFLNLARIHNPYTFTAMGSVIGFKVSTYQKLRGMTPYASGEDFYFVQKLVKNGNVLLWHDSLAYPDGRYSDRVGFGTGPALNNLKNLNRTSYPLYSDVYFNEIKETFDHFEELYKKDVELPMTRFLKSTFKTDDLWQPLRDNYKDMENFTKACVNKVDALRILQYLHFRQSSHDAKDIVYPVESYKHIREDMYSQEQKQRRQHDLNIS